MHRRPHASDFIGKTIIRAGCEYDDILRLWFSDGTGIAIETETHVLVVCDECLGTCPTQEKDTVNG